MEKTLQVYLPYQKSTITQRFGENANPLYAGDGLKGHTAYDWVVPWATPIPNCTSDAYCYSIMHQNDPVLMDYRAAFFIVETEAGLYEVSYGHMSTILAVPGQMYQVGDTIGLVGNTGPVFVGQHEVTEAEKDKGSRAGAHLHGPQIRPVKKVKDTTTRGQYLTTEKGIYQDSEGYCYLVPNYDNGYNGCVSLAPFSTEMLASFYKEQQAAKLQKATEIVKNVAVAVNEVKNLPPEQQNSFIEGLKSILSALLTFLKR